MKPQVYPMDLAALFKYNYGHIEGMDASFTSVFGHRIANSTSSKILPSRMLS